MRTSIIARTLADLEGRWTAKSNPGIKRCIVCFGSSSDGGGLSSACAQFNPCGEGPTRELLQDLRPYPYRNHFPRRQNIREGNTLARAIMGTVVAGGAGTGKEIRFLVFNRASIASLVE